MNKRHLWIVLAERKDKTIWNRKVRKRKRNVYIPRIYTKYKYT